MTDKQRLVYLAIKIAFMVKSSRRFQFMKRDVFHAWVIEQLNDAGFETDEKGELIKDK